VADNEQLEILQQGVAVWNRWREENPHVKIDLSHAHLEKADLRGANLSHARLERANLSHACLDNANLALAHLEGAVLLYAHLEGADLRAAQLRRAALEDAILVNADLSNAHIERTMMAYANCKNAILVNARLDGVNLIGANIEGANVSSVVFNQTGVWRFLKETRLSLKAIWKSRDDLILETTIRCKGINAECYGSQRFKRFVRDQDFLEEIMESPWGKAACFAWWLFAGCGRSMLRWTFWSLSFVMIFAVVYWSLGARHLYTPELKFNFVTTLYYSIVTFTTLGGNVFPATSLMAMFTAGEVCIGYLMLGGLISIISNKLARRGI